MSAVVAFGPSLIDICARLPDERYAACQRLLGLTGPGRRRLDDYRAVRQLVRTMAGRPVPEGGVLDAVRACPDLVIGAGSTTLGMLTAMPSERRAGSTFISVLGRQAGDLDPMSRLFAETVSGLGIAHESTVAAGHNPVGFVLSGHSQPDRTLATYPGVASVFGGTDLRRLDPELVLMDVYELVAGQLAAFLRDTIDAGEFPIALSLGNHRLLAGGLGERVRAWVRDRRVQVLCGNSDEYRALYPDLDARLATLEGFREHPVRGCVSYALMTSGAHGLAAHWAGSFVSADAVPVDPDRIVNTSGVGDAAAGWFCAGVLDGADPSETLRGSARLASAVLLVLHPQPVKDSDGRG